MPAITTRGAASAKAFGWSGTYIPVPTVIGQAYGGGYYAGQIGVSGVATHYLVIGPVSTAQNLAIKFKNADTASPGSSSIDGPDNTALQVADGSSTVYPMAHFCNDLVIGGFSDWYAPATNELEVCYFNLKPTTDSNNTAFPSGQNLNAVPQRLSNYTALGAPLQTSVTAFQDGGAQQFGLTNAYWTSSTVSATLSRDQTFTNGGQYSDNKSITRYGRAVRRVAV